MPPSTRSLVRVAIAPLSIAVLAACQPGPVQARLLGAGGVTAQAVSFDSLWPTAAQSGAAGAAAIQPDLARPDGAGADGLIAAEREAIPAQPAAPPAGPGAVPFAAFEAGPPSAVVVGAMGALGSLARADRGAYAVGLEALSRSVGAATGLDPTSLLDAWSRTSDRRMEALLAALTQVGVDYRYASSTPGSAFDCSGLVAWAWSIAGADLPHQSSAIIHLLPHGDLSTVQPADVLWYPGHVSLALGVGDAFVDAPNSGNTVRIVAHHGSSAARALVVGVAA